MLTNIFLIELTTKTYRNVVKQNLLVRIELIDSNTETLDQNHLEHEMILPIDNNFQLALPHFLYYEMHAMLNVAPFGSLF